MEPSLLQKVKDQLLKYEGLKLKPYRCQAGTAQAGCWRICWEKRQHNINFEEKYLPEM